MDNLYAIGIFLNGELEGYVRKGRNRAISAYDNLISAKRGLSECKGSFAIYYPNKEVKVVRLQVCEVIE